MKMLSGLLFLTIAAGAIGVCANAQKTPSLKHDYLDGVAQQGVASPGCRACRDNCVNRREQCKNLACTHAGGRNKGPQCDTGGNPNWNQKRFEDELKACTENEKGCWSQCDAGACR